MRRHGKVLDMVSLGLKAATIAAPSWSMFGGGGAGNQVDPMGAQRQQTFQEELEEGAGPNGAGPASAGSRANAATAQQKSSSLTDWLIFGGVGLVLFGTVGCCFIGMKGLIYTSSEWELGFLAMKIKRRREIWGSLIL